MIDSNQTECDLAYLINTHPLYRFAQLWTFLVSLVAVPFLLHFLLSKVMFLHFHGNLKCLLIFYFLSILSFSASMCFGFGYHFIVPFFVSSKCTLIINVTLFKWCHLLGMSLLTISMLLPIGFSIERFVALAMAEKYENVRIFIGPILVFVLTGLDLKIVYSVYQTERFNDNSISFVMTPTTSSTQVNIYFSSLLAVKVFNLICNCILIKIHNRMKRRYYRRTHTLSLRYEMEEILQSSKFTLIISFSHLLFYGWYLIVTIFVRLVGESFFGSFLNYTVFRGIYCTVPTYSLVIVVIGHKALLHLNIQRHNRVQSTVQIKSTGREGARNYENAISSYWDSFSHGLDRINH